MKNLEEEIEVEDENDYLPPKPLTKINIKTKDNNYKYNINKNTQPKDEKKNKTNYIINIKRVDKIKNTKDKIERHAIGEYKKNNISDNKNNPPKITNYNYFESSYKKNPNKITSITIQKDKNDKDKITKTSITKIDTNKKQEERPRPKYPQYIPQHINQMPIQIKRPLQTQNPFQSYKSSQNQKTIQQKTTQQLQKSSQQQKTTQQSQKNEKQKPQIQQIGQKSTQQPKKDSKDKPIQRIKPQINLNKLDTKIKPQKQIETKQLQEVNNYGENKEEKDNKENEKDKIYRLGNGYSHVLKMVGVDNNGNVLLNPNSNRDIKILFPGTTENNKIKEGSMNVHISNPKFSERIQSAHSKDPKEKTFHIIKSKNHEKKLPKIKGTMSTEDFDRIIDNPNPTLNIKSDNENNMSPKITKVMRKSHSKLNI